MDIRVSKKKSIVGRPDRFIKLGFNIIPPILSSISIFNGRDNRDITDKFNIKIIDNGLDTIQWSLEK